VRGNTFTAPVGRSAPFVFESLVDSRGVLGQRRQDPVRHGRSDSRAVLSFDRMTREELLSRISVDPKICSGRPCIRGHRIWVSLILDLLASGSSIAQILADYPGIEEADILACIAYGAELSRERLRVKTAEQERVALDQRAANERAARARKPLPFPNLWDAVDPTKVARDASPDEMQASYVAFSKLCRPRPRRRHRL
jgi:uncharacterized protein (DUF433 family)